jgi:hypothetical protein
LSEIVADPYTRRCGSERFCWRVIEDPRTLEALEQNVRDEIESCAQSLRTGQAFSRSRAPE